MRTAIVLLVSLVVTVPALAGPPANGTYKSTDIGGTMLPGRYTEYQPASMAVGFDNTVNEMSWDGATLGGQWWWYCPWVSMPPALVYDGVVGGNGQRIWTAQYSDGTCWLDGGGPWAGGDASYSAAIDTWTAIITETYSGGLRVGSVRTISASATFNGYNADCMSLEVSNTEMIGSTLLGHVLPVDYPDFWYWLPCASVGTAGPGEWGTVEGITFSITGCTIPVEQTSWGRIKQIYE